MGRAIVKRGKQFNLSGLKLNKFPNCIGNYPDKGCQKATPKKPGKDCECCPHYK